MKSFDLRKRLAKDPRLSRIIHGGFSAIASRGVALLVSAITLPLTVRYLGAQQYGIWVTISTSMVMLAVMDLGIANSLTNMISKAYAEDDPRAAQGYYSTAIWLTSGLCLLFAMIAVLVWPHVRWGPLFHLSDPSIIHETMLSVAVMVAFFLLSLPLNLIHKVLSGYQQTQISNYFSLVSSLLGLLVILVVISVKGSLLTLVLVYSCSLLGGTALLNLWVHVWHKRWLFPNPRVISRPIARELMNTGFGFFVLQMAGLVVFNSDNLIITHFLGAAEVAPYSVTWRLAGYAAVLQQSVFPSLWPAYSEAYVRGDFAWVRRTFWRAVRLSMGTAALAVAVMALFGRQIIGWYVSPTVMPSQALLLAICGWTLLSAGMDLEACLLAAVGRVKWQGILSVVAAALNIVISVFLVQRIGSLGVILGTVLSYVLVLVVPQSVIVKRVLYGGDQPVSSGAIDSSAATAKVSLGKQMRRRVFFLFRWTTTLFFRLGVKAAAFLRLVPYAEPIRPGEQERILVVALGGFLGDTIMLLPMIEALREAHPHARIEMATQGASAVLLRKMEQLDSVHSLALPTSPSDPKRLVEIVKFYWRELRNYRPHTCIAPRWGDDPFRALVLGYLTQAPRRVGFAANSFTTRKPAGTYRNALLTDVIDGGEGLHEPAKFVYLLRQAGLISLVEPSLRSVSEQPSATLQRIANSVEFSELARRLNLSGDLPFAVIAPGASIPRRVWPIQRWNAVVEHLHGLGVQTVLLSGPQDAELAQEVHRRAPQKTVLVAGSTTLPESVALLSRAELFLGNDSGPGHMAGAVGTPSVIFSITSDRVDPNDLAAPERIRPMGPSVVVCRPAESIPPCVDTCTASTAHCIELITPEVVLNTVDRLLRPLLVRQTDLVV